MPSDRDAAAEVKRLHPTSLLFGLGSAVRNFLVPGLILLFWSRSGGVQVWLMLGFVPVAAILLVQYFNYRYTLGRDEMVIREGVLTRNVRHIRYDRIQNIDLIQNPLHRLFGVAVVRLETASGGKAEAELKVLSLAAVEEMRSHVFSDRDEQAPASPDPDAVPAERGEGRRATAGQRLVELPLGELVMLGIISNRGMVMIAAVLGLLSQSGRLDVDPEEWSPVLQERFQAVPEFLTEGTPLGLALIGLVALVLFLVLVRLLSVAWAIVQFYGFTLTRNGDDLRATYGLLTRITATLPSHRIQLLTTHRSRLHRWFGRGSVQVETAGGGGEENGTDATRRQWLAPVLPADRIAGLVEEVLPGVQLTRVDWTPIEARAWKRVFRRGLIWVVPLTAAAGFVFVPWGLLVAVPALGLAYHHARASVAATGYALIPGAILFKSGWWGQRMSVVRTSKIQAVSLCQSPFDRRHSMARVAVDTAGAGRAGHRIEIPFLESSAAGGLATRLFGEASRTEFRW